MSDDPAAVDESAAEPTETDDTSESDVAETAGADLSDGESDAEPVDDEQPIEDPEATIEALQAEVESLEDTIEAQAAEIDDLTDSLSRSRADFQNYKKRMQNKQDEMQARATEDLVTQFTKIRENLVRALDQDEDADIRPGVKSTLDEFDAILEAENVEIISPEPGDEVDPKRHEVMMRVESDQPDGTIADVYQDGYELAGKVLQAAQVTVSSDDA